MDKEIARLKMELSDNVKINFTVKDVKISLSHYNAEVDRTGKITICKVLYDEAPKHILKSILCHEYGHIIRKDNEHSSPFAMRNILLYIEHGADKIAAEMNGIHNMKLTLRWILWKNRASGPSGFIRDRIHLLKKLEAERYID